LNDFAIITASFVAEKVGSGHMEKVWKPLKWFLLKSKILKNIPERS